MWVCVFMYWSGSVVGHSVMPSLGASFFHVEKSIQLQVYSGFIKN